MNTRRTRLLLLGVITLALAVTAGDMAWRLKPKSNPPQASLPKEEVNEGGPLHPLMIEAIKTKEYPGSAITTEQELGDRGGYQAKVVSYRSDGFKIYALMTAPPGSAPAAGWPVVILNHGYIPPAQYRTTGSDYSSWIGRLTREGFVVIKPDYRGHDRSEGLAESGHYSAVYTYDVLNLVSSVKKQPGLNPRAIGMIGHSMGGNVSLRAVLASSDIKASLMAAGVVGSPEDLMFNWHRPNRQPSAPGMFGNFRQKLLDEFGDPRQNPQFWDKVNPLNYLSSVNGHMQIHHGSADTSVPPLFSQHLHEAMIKAGKPAELFIYEGGDHNFTSHNRLFLERAVSFFRQALR